MQVWHWEGAEALDGIDTALVHLQAEIKSLLFGVCDDRPDWGRAGAAVGGSRGDGWYRHAAGANGKQISEACCLESVMIGLIGVVQVRQWEGAEVMDGIDTLLVPMAGRYRKLAVWSL